MIGLKTKMMAAIILAVLSALLLAGASFILFPDKTSNGMPIPMPVPNQIYQLVWSLQWLGFAALVAAAVVGAILLVSKIKRKKAE